MAYKGPIEAALSSDLRGEPYNFSLWDIYTGTQIVVFKGNKGNPIAKCLQLIDNNYFITVTDNVLQVWSIFNRKCQDQKLFLPARPSVICMSPCGQYLVAGISEMIYVWQIRSGNLLAHAQRHYQTVSVLRMNHDGTFLISGGEDGMVLVWPFADLISNTHHCSLSNTGAQDKSKRQTAGGTEPRTVWQHHSAQVTDVHITDGSLCLTASTDQTVNIYSYKTGKRLHSVSFPTPIWSVVMNKNETRLFAGGKDGNIYETATSSLSLSLINTKRMNGDVGDETSQRPMFSGHKDTVSSLIVSIDGTRLISASKDCSCKIWDIQQRKMILDIKHQAPLANLTTLLIPDSLALASMSQSLAKPPLQLKPLKRQLYKAPRDSTIMESDLFEESSTTIIHARNSTKIWNSEEQSPSALATATNLRSQLEWHDNGELSEESRANNDKKSVENLKEKIQELYMLSAEKIFQDAAQDSLKPFKALVEELRVEEEEKKKRSPAKKATPPAQNGGKPSKRLKSA